LGERWKEKGLVGGVLGVGGGVPPSSNIRRPGTGGGAGDRGLKGLDFNKFTHLLSCRGVCLVLFWGIRREREREGGMTYTYTTQGRS
jgi:hypothetical protein